MPKSPFANFSRISIGATLASAIVAFIGCTFTQDLDPYKSEECAAGSKACEVEGDDLCVPLNDTRYGCGVLNVCAPCSFSVQNAEPTCAANGQCAVASCSPGFGNCDGNAANGCETNILSNANFCGSCTTPCNQNFPNTSGSPCVGGKCELTCLSGFENCNLVLSDGCECNQSTHTCVNRVCTLKGT